MKNLVGNLDFFLLKSLSELRTARTKTWFLCLKQPPSYEKLGGKLRVFLLKSLSELRTARIKTWFLCLKHPPGYEKLGRKLRFFFAQVLVRAAHSSNENLVFVS